MARKFKCEKCGEFIVVKWMEHGGTTECRRCGAQMIVPENTEEVSAQVAEEYLKSPKGPAKANFCGRCGTKLEGPSQICKKCGMDNTEPENFGEASSTSREETSLSSRYKSAYVVANSIISNGNAIKGFGIFLALLVGAAAVIGGAQMESITIFIVGAVLSISIGLFLNAIGTIVAAQGQTLLALLDSAVNTSPLIDNKQKAAIIGVKIP